MKMLWTKTKASSMKRFSTRTPGPQREDALEDQGKQHEEAQQDGEGATLKEDLVSPSRGHLRGQNRSLEQDPHCQPPIYAREPQVSTSQQHEAALDEDQGQQREDALHEAAGPAA